MTRRGLIGGRIPRRLDRKPAPRRRRSQLELRLTRFVHIGQLWRCRETGELWRVAQVYRMDGRVILVGERRPLGNYVRYLPIIELARHGDWLWVAKETSCAR